MRLYLQILVSGVLGSGIVLLQLAVGSSIVLAILGNALFCAGVAAGVALGRQAPGPLALALAPASYMMTAVAFGIAGALAYAWSKSASLAMMSLLALGYSSSAGPDTPFEARLPVWILSNLLLIALGIAAGLLIRRMRRASAGAGSR